MRKNNEFREFLLTKLINSERAAMYGPDFKAKMIRTQKQLLEDMSKEYIEKEKDRKHHKVEHEEVQT